MGLLKGLVGERGINLGKKQERVCKFFFALYHIPSVIGGSELVIVIFFRGSCVWCLGPRYYGRISE